MQYEVLHVDQCHNKKKHKLTATESLVQRWAMKYKCARHGVEQVGRVSALNYFHLVWFS